MGVAGDATRCRDLATFIEGAPVEEMAAAAAAVLLLLMLAPSSATEDIDGSS